MLKSIADFLIAFLDLVEAEAISARRGIVVLGAVLMIGLAATLLILSALGLLVWAFYIILTRVMEQPGALSLCALTLILIAGAFLCHARRMLR